MCLLLPLCFAGRLAQTSRVPKQLSAVACVLCASHTQRGVRVFPALCFGTNSSRDSFLHNTRLDVFLIHGPSSSKKNNNSGSGSPCRGTTALIRPLASAMIEPVLCSMKHSCWVWRVCSDSQDCQSQRQGELPGLIHGILSQATARRRTCHQKGSVGVGVGQWC